MAPSSRDRISIDLRGLRAALFERARADGVTPSDFVRTVVAGALGGAERLKQAEFAPLRSAGKGRTRLSLRMSAEQARMTLDAARRHRMSAGDYVGQLVAGVPVLSEGGKREQHVAALITSCAAMATFSRNLHSLATLLRQADVESARPYRLMLDSLNGDVRLHLDRAARVLAALQPRGYARPQLEGSSRSGTRG